MHLHPVKHQPGEVEVRARPQAGQVGRDVGRARPLLEQQAIPFLQRVIVQVQARVFSEVRCAEQGAGLAAVAAAVSPAMQGADDVAAGGGAGPERTAALEDHGLAMPADVGNEFHPARGAQQRAALAFLRQRVVVARLGHCELVPHIAGPSLEDDVHLALEQRWIEVTGNW